MKTELTMQTFVKYADCFQDTLYQDAAYVYNYSANKFLHYNYWNLTPSQLCTKVVNLVVCGSALL